MPGVRVDCSLAGWVLLEGNVPNEPGAWAGGDDCGLTLPLGVGVLWGMVWAEAAVTLRAKAAAKARKFFMESGLDKGE